MFDKSEFEKSLSLNIGLMAKQLQKARYSLTDLDRIGDEVLELIQDRAEQISINNPLQIQNVENLIIMILMHGAITSQKEFINITAKRLKITTKAVETEMMKDTISMR